MATSAAASSPSRRWISASCVRAWASSGSAPVLRATWSCRSTSEPSPVAGTAPDAVSRGSGRAEALRIAAELAGAVNCWRANHSRWRVGHAATSATRRQHPPPPPRARARAGGHRPFDAAPARAAARARADREGRLRPVLVRGLRGPRRRHAPRPAPRGRVAQRRRRPARLRQQRRQDVLELVPGVEDRGDSVLRERGVIVESEVPRDRGRARLRPMHGSDDAIVSGA